MLKVTIVSPERTLFQGEAMGVKVPGQQGLFEVLTDHAPIISILSKGRVQCKGEQPFEIDIQSGFIEVAQNNVAVCVEL